MGWHPSLFVSLKLLSANLNFRAKITNGEIRPRPVADKNYEIWNCPTFVTSPNCVHTYQPFTVDYYLICINNRYIHNYVQFSDLAEN